MSGPASFGTGGLVNESVGSGSLVAINGSGSGLLVPGSYASGAALASSDTFTGATFASLGFKPGTYTYIWGTGPNADSFVVTGAVPEPSTWALLAAGIVGLGLVLRQRRRTAWLA